MRRILGQKFFERDTVLVAKDLLGKLLVRRLNGKELVVMITEVEVYDGFRDKASHAARGKTARNSVMFGPAGHWYVYFTYGMHWMLNIVTREKDYPAAVLIRGGIEADGRRFSKNGRSGKTRILDGPAKLTKLLKTDKKLNGLPANRKSGLWIENRGFMFHDSRSMIRHGPRVGVHYAGPYWAKRKWRFWVDF